MIYDDGSLRNLKATVQQAVRDIGPHRNRFDFLVVTGMSGALVGAPVAMQLDIPLVVVRKHGDGSHSSGDLINGEEAFGAYLFLDDLICTGWTYHRVRQRMDQDGAPAEYAGTYFYDSPTLSWDGDGIIDYFPGTGEDGVANWSVLVDRRHNELSAA